MLLTKLTRKLRQYREDQNGIALAAVMALMLIGVLLSSLIITAVVGGLATTTASRAGVQAEASAEAGVDVSLAALTSGTCTSTFTSSTAPIYTSTIYYSTASSISTATWTAGCPTTSATFVKIVSAGTAAALGEAGDSSSNSQRIEAIYSRPVSTVTIPAVGPAIFAYSSNAFDGSGTLLSPTGTANVIIKTGNVSCSGGAAAQGELVVFSGTLTLSGSCGVTGSALASGAINLSGGVAIGDDVYSNTSVSVNSGSVGGNVESLGSVSLSPAAVTGDVIAGTTATLGSSATVAGNLWAGTTFTSGGGTVSGTASASTINLGSSDTVNGTAYSTGSSTVTFGGNFKTNLYAGSLTYNGSNSPSTAVYHVSGASTLNNSLGSIKLFTKTWSGKGGSNITIQNPVTMVAAPAAPSMDALPSTPPVWASYHYHASDWSGYTVYTLTTQAQCSVTGINAAVASFGGAKGVIDARVCTSPLGLGTLSGEGGMKTAIANNLAIITNYGFNMGGSGGFTSTKSSPNANLWLIQQDGGTATSPTCPSGSTYSYAGGFTMQSNINVMMYSPCEVTLTSSAAFTGQVFAYEVDVSGAATMTYQAVGLPGFDLSTGLATTTTTSANAWTTVSTRNVSG